ncbi:MAG: ORF6N domain-containing protein [Bacteroidales bacterium]|nr:ORF6N domain-containing protein [Bacteroidales bacterium]
MTNITEVENRIITLRGQQVILANHVAELYGVETREVNQAIKNNPNKFPNGYILELDKKEKDERVTKKQLYGHPLFHSKEFQAS